MKSKSLTVALAMAIIPLALFWGCNKGSQPLSPANSSALNILLSSVGRPLLLASQNSLLYVVSGSGVPSVTGILGPISASSLSSGYSFSLSLSSNKYNLISLELENAAGLEAMDIGAVTLLGSGSIPVTLGPLNKVYYSVSSLFTGYGYGFESNALTFVGANTATTVSGIDVVSNLTSNSLGYELDNPALTNDTVAYMGNSNFVNYLTVPPISSFNSSSSLSKKSILGGGILPLAVGDVYCIKMKAGGYAWLQITDAGVVGISGPSFVFRVNTTLPYCGYEQTTADLAGSSTLNGTPTPFAPVTSVSGLFTGNPYGIAVFPANSAAGSIFVSDAVSGTNTSYVRIISAAGLTQINSISGLPWAQGLAVNSAGSTLYVAETYSQGAPSVQVYSLASLQSSGTVGNGIPAPPVAVTPGVTPGPDLPADALLGEMAAPEFLAIAPNSGIYPNGLFVTDSGTNGIANLLVFSNAVAGAGAATYWNGQIGTSTSPAGVATDGVTVYVADSGHNQIETYNVNGLAGNTWTTDNNPAGAVAFSGPQGIALNSALGEIFIADTKNNRIVEMTTTGLFKATWGTWGLGNGVTPSTFSLPTAIAVDGASPPNVYVADSGNKRVLQFKGL
jgi:hypothetical protein